MPTVATDLLVAFETHAVEDIRAVVDGGFPIHEPLNGKPVVTWLVEMYTRSDRFSECLRLLLERGAELDDPLVTPVLLNDADMLQRALQVQPSLTSHRTSLPCAFTPLKGAPLLHVACEYGHLDVARVLIEHGADVNACAALDEYGLNGHTALFHTVNSNANRSAPLMALLLAAGVRVDVRLDGIRWGAGFDWETICYDVTPLSYAQLGLLPQMHRHEREIQATIDSLLRAAGRMVPPAENVPNRYLQARP